MTFTNVDALIIQPQHKKALECVIIGDKIGVFSDLWKERIETKIETMLKMKFYILYRKIKHLVKNYSEVKTLIESYKEEDNNNNQLKESIIDPETNFFRYLSSTQGVIQDEWDSDKDIIDQANKKVILTLI